MKMCKKCWRRKRLTGVILACLFLTACGGETQETESKNVVQESETVSTSSTVEQTDEQTQEAVQQHVYPFEYRPWTERINYYQSLYPDQKGKEN